MADVTTKALASSKKTCGRTAGNDHALTADMLVSVRRRVRPQQGAMHEEGGPTAAGETPAAGKTSVGQKAAPVRVKTRPPSGQAGTPGKSDPQDGYKVGFKKPPSHSRFKSGQSGNPKGRPKASRNAKTVIHEAMFKVRTLTIDGKKERMSQFEIGIHQLFNKFMTGDVRAGSQVLGLLSKMEELGNATKAEGRDEPIVPALTDGGKQRMAKHQATVLREAGLSEDKIAEVLARLGLSLGSASNDDEADE